MNIHMTIFDRELFYKALQGLTFSLMSPFNITYVGCYTVESVSS